MYKTLVKALLAAILALAVLIGLKNQLIQPARAVEIQPGTIFKPESSELTTYQSVITTDSWSSLTGGTGIQATEVYQADPNDVHIKGDLPVLEAFIPLVQDGRAGGVRGLYILDVLALRIVQQPDGQYDFISYEEDTATQFQSPSQFGVIGLLAHNFLSGRLFFEILPGQILTIIYGDGQTEDFQVAEIQDYQRLTELDLHSDFLDLQNDQTLTADQVFQRYYQGDRHLTLQTCLEKDGNWNWGIRMIMAFPV